MEKAKTPSQAPLCAAIPLKPEKIAKKSISGLMQIASAFASMAIFALLFFPALLLRTGPHGLLGTILVTFGVLAICVCTYEFFYFRRYFYDIRNGTLIIRKGVFTLSETTVPLSRIQDVMVVRDLLDKAFGLYNLHVSTATAQSGLHAHIDGLSEEGAERLKALLLPSMLRRRGTKN